MRVVAVRLLVLCTLIALVAAWSKEDHEIFQLRDDVALGEGPDVTFYDFLGVKQSASLAEIDKAYRKKARLMHPDKVKQSFIASKATQKKTGKKPGVHVNKPPSEREVDKAVKQANERFARLGLVSNILRGPGRDRYDHFLKNGFPKWRGTGYYYTRFRPGLGSVLLGLFIFGGGAVHYGILVLNYKRQRDFVERYIRHARRAAWGDESGLGGIPGLDGTVAPPQPSEGVEPEPNAVPMNRRQKRAMEKDNKREKSAPKKQSNKSGTSTPTSTGGQRRRVTAENGKVLIVNQSGDVYLEEEIDGEVQEFLLDVDEIERPTIRNTALCKVPVWAFDKVLGRFRPSQSHEEDVDILDEPSSIGETTGTPALNGSAKRRNKKNGISS